MDYFRILNLNKEPFSNSPEPEFFFQSLKHLSCLQKIELAVRLRRGLNVVIGDVGTGKTTLCRQLILKFSEPEYDGNDTETHLLMDPGFTNSIEFLSVIAQAFGIQVSHSLESEWQFKESIKKYLLKKGVDEGKIIVLIIDEGQKLPDFCIEILREFLNYETNEYKLLQIVIFAQREFRQTLKKHKNFADRVNLFYFLKPLNLRETFGMVRFRIAKAGNSGQTPSLFTCPGLLALYFTTKGYPRKIVTLCHQVILALIIQNRSKAGWFVVSSCSERVSAISKKDLRWSMAAALFVILVLCGLVFVGTTDIIPVKATVDKIKDKQFIPVVKIDPVEAVLAENKPLHKPAAQAFEKIPEPVKTIPELIGKLAIREGEIVWHIMADFYGDFSNTVFQKVVLANPHINNLDNVISGQVLNLPAIPAKSNPMPSKKYLVRVAIGEDIRKIYDLYNDYKKLLPSLAFIPYWNRNEGMVFAVLLKNGFDNMESAKSMIDKLPHAIASNAKIYEKLDDDTLFFFKEVSRKGY